jgi:hypothetical protein
VYVYLFRVVQDSFTKFERISTLSGLCVYRIFGRAFATECHVQMLTNKCMKMREVLM